MTTQSAKLRLGNDDDDKVVTHQVEDNEDKQDGKPSRPDRPRSDKPFRVRRTGNGSNKVIFESSDERAVQKFVSDNFPRPHHESEDHDVYVESPSGAKTAYTAGMGEDGWDDYKTPREREDG